MPVRREVLPVVARDKQTPEFPPVTALITRAGNASEFEKGRNDLEVVRVAV